MTFMWADNDGEWIREASLMSEPTNNSGNDSFQI